MKNTEPSGSHDFAHKAQKTTCDFCGASFALNAESENPGDCMECGATWRDRGLLEMLLSFECPPGTQNFKALVNSLEQNTKVLASIGPLFDRPNTTLPGLRHLFSAKQIAGEGRRAPRIPVKVRSLDYLIVHSAHDMAIPINEALKSLRPAGVLIVTGGFIWPLPQPPNAIITIPTERATISSIAADPIAQARQVGALAWFERPGLGTHVLQRDCFLIVASPQSVVI